MVISQMIKLLSFHQKLEFIQYRACLRITGATPGTFIKKIYQGLTGAIRSTFITGAMPGTFITGAILGTFITGAIPGTFITGAIRGTFIEKIYQGLGLE